MNVLLIFLLAQTRAATPVKKVSCTMTNHSYTLVTKKGDKWVNEDRDDWWIHCKVSVGDKIKLEQDLPIAHPTELRDAVAAVDEFRKTH